MKEKHQVLSSAFLPAYARLFPKKQKYIDQPLKRYLSKVSGPLVDRIDIYIDVPAVSFRRLRSWSRQLDSASEMMLKQAMTEFSLSARAHDKICKLARTIADFAGAENIAPEHIAEATSYRQLDR